MILCKKRSDKYRYLILKWKVDTSPEERIYYYDFTNKKRKLKNKTLCYDLHNEEDLTCLYRLTQINKYIPTFIFMKSVEIYNKYVLGLENDNKKRTIPYQGGIL